MRNIDLLDCAYHSLRIIQSKRVHMDGIYIHNRVNRNSTSRLMGEMCRRRTHSSL